LPSDRLWYPPARRSDYDALAIALLSLPTPNREYPQAEGE
jgi:hypothetical protein